jgi:hypothetical protein
MSSMSRFQKKLLIILCLLALLSPIGIIFPEQLRSGDAWGEWSAENIEKMLGYVPKGFDRIKDIWAAPLPDYNVAGNDSSLFVKVISYVFSGFIGISACILIFFILLKILKGTRE